MEVVFIVFAYGFDDGGKILGVFSTESHAKYFVEKERKKIIENMKAEMKRELKTDIKMNEYQITHQKAMKLQRDRYLANIVSYSKDYFDDLHIKEFQIDEKLD